MNRKDGVINAYATRFFVGFGLGFLSGFALGHVFNEDAEVILGLTAAPLGALIAIMTKRGSRVHEVVASIEDHRR